MKRTSQYIIIYGVWGCIVSVLLGYGASFLSAGVIFSLTLVGARDDGTFGIGLLQTVPNAVWVLVSIVGTVVAIRRGYRRGMTTAQAEDGALHRLMLGSLLVGFGCVLGLVYYTYLSYVPREPSYCSRDEDCAYSIEERSCLYCRYYIGHGTRVCGRDSVGCSVVCSCAAKRCQTLPK